MDDELEIFKKKLLYRASYRGTKEMDILLSSFVKKHIDNLNLNNLKELENFLKFDDEIILNFYNHNKIERDIDKNPISKIFKKFKIKWRRGGDSNPRTSCPVAGFQDQCFQPLSHLSLKLNLGYLILSKE